MTKKGFEKLVKEGIEAIPEKFLKGLDNVDIVVEEEPTVHQLQKMKSHRDFFLLGLYEGVPQTKRGYYGQILPDKITIFKKPIEGIAQNNQGRIREIVKNTVWHEIAHHFGMDEKKVRGVEKKRRLR